MGVITERPASRKRHRNALPASRLAALNGYGIFWGSSFPQNYPDSSRITRGLQDGAAQPPTPRAKAVGQTTHRVDVHWHHPGPAPAPGVGAGTAQRLGDRATAAGSGRRSASRTGSRVPPAPNGSSADLQRRFWKRTCDLLVALVVHDAHVRLQGGERVGSHRGPRV